MKNAKFGDDDLEEIDCMEEIEKKFKRLIYLHYLGTPVPFPIPEIFKHFDKYYESLKLVVLTDINKLEKTCGVHRDGTVLFAFVVMEHLKEDDGFKMPILVKFSETYKKFLKFTYDKFSNIDTVGIKLINRSVLIRKNIIPEKTSCIEEHEVSPRYFKYLKDQISKQ